MALTYTKQLPSGSTNGRPIQVNATASPGTTFHTVAATATAAREEVYLYAQNVSTATSPSELTIECGGTATTDEIVLSLAELDGLNLVLPGITFTATTSIVRAYATATGIFHLVGWVNRAT